MQTRAGEERNGDPDSRSLPNQLEVSRRRLPPRQRLRLVQPPPLRGVATRGTVKREAARLDLEDVAMAAQAT